MNDPNGLVYFEGEYHLFFQFNPQGDTPGHISWGHAVSKDLLHWQELPVAIPAIAGDQNELVFTGSVVVDDENSSRLCANNKPCLVAIYTAHHDKSGTETENREAQALAVSQDRGRTWQRFAGNPVLDVGLPEFRDPSVSWSEENHAWLMAVSLPNEHQVAFFTSPNLKQWSRLSTFGPAGITNQHNPKAQWECPDLLHIPADSGKGPGTWALKVGMNPGSPQGGSGEQYFLGNFDGRTFTPSTLPGAHGWTDYGKDSYCAISYNNLPQTEQPTLIGWMDNWQYADKLPTIPWRGQMTLPRRVTWLTDSAGQSLKQDPVVAPLRIGKPTDISRTLKPDQALTLPSLTVPAELTLNIQPNNAQTTGLRLYSDFDHYTEIAYNLTTHQLYTDRTHSLEAATAPPDFLARTEAPTAPTRPYDLHIILDRSSIEVFAQDGTIAMTTLVLPSTTKLRVELFTRGNTQPTQITGKSWQLQPIW